MLLRKLSLPQAALLLSQRQRDAPGRARRIPRPTSTRQPAPARAGMLPRWRRRRRRESANTTRCSWKRNGNVSCRGASPTSSSRAGRHRALGRRWRRKPQQKPPPMPVASAVPGKTLPRGWHGHRRAQRSLTGRRTLGGDRHYHRWSWVRAKGQLSGRCRRPRWFFRPLQSRYNAACFVFLLT